MRSGRGPSVYFPGWCREVWGVLVCTGGERLGVTFKKHSPKASLDASGARGGKRAHYHRQANLEVLVKEW